MLMPHGYPTLAISSDITNQLFPGHQSKDSNGDRGLQGSDGLESGSMATGGVTAFRRNG